MESRRDRYLYVVSSLIGENVSVCTSDEKKFECVFHTATPFKNMPHRLVFKGVTQVSGDRDLKMEGGTMVVDASKLVCASSKNLSLKEQRSNNEFGTDGDISQDAGGGRSRALEMVDSSWLAPTVDKQAEERRRAAKAFYAKNQFDQFKANEHLFSIKSSFDESKYTTPLGEYTEAQKASAARIAGQIEAQKSHNVHVAEERGQVSKKYDHLDEEDRYSGVVRPDKLRPSSSSSQQKSASKNKLSSSSSSISTKTTSATPPPPPGVIHPNDPAAKAAAPAASPPVPAEKSTKDAVAEAPAPVTKVEAASEKEEVATSNGVEKEANSKAEAPAAAAAAPSSSSEGFKFNATAAEWKPNPTAAEWKPAAIVPQPAAIPQQQYYQPPPPPDGPPPPHHHRPPYHGRMQVDYSQRGGYAAYDEWGNPVQPMPYMYQQYPPPMHPRYHQPRHSGGGRNQNNNYRG